jgi:hypothetical protein
MDSLEKFIETHRTAFDLETPNLSVWMGIENDLNADVENFVRANRADFDTEIPNLKIWAAIDKTVNKSAETRFFYRQWLGRIAAAVTLLIVGASGGIYWQTKQEARAIAQTVAQIAPEFRATEQFYKQKVQAELVKLARFQPEADPSVLADLKQIDDVQKELKEELDDAPVSAREEIVKRMIDNYKIKLGILARVLQHLEDDKINNLEEKERQQHEKI